MQRKPIFCAQWQRRQGCLWMPPATDLFGDWIVDRVGAFLFYNDVYNVGTMSGRTLVSLDQAPPQFTAHSCDSCDVHKYLWIPRHCGPDHTNTL